MTPSNEQVYLPAGLAESFAPTAQVVLTTLRFVAALPWTVVISPYLSSLNVVSVSSSSVVNPLVLSTSTLYTTVAQPDVGLEEPSVLINFAAAGASPAVTVALSDPETEAPLELTASAVTVSVTVEFSGTAPEKVHVKLSPGFARVNGNVMDEPADVQDMLVAVVAAEQAGWPAEVAMVPYTVSQIRLTVSLPVGLLVFVTVTV